MGLWAGNRPFIAILRPGAEQGVRARLGERADAEGAARELRAEEAVVEMAEAMEAGTQVDMDVEMADAEVQAGSGELQVDAEVQAAMGVEELGVQVERGVDAEVQAVVCVEAGVHVDVQVSGAAAAPDDLRCACGAGLFPDFSCRFPPCQRFGGRNRRRGMASD